MTAAEADVVAIEDQSLTSDVFGKEDVGKGRKALADLIGPVKGMLMAGRVLGAISGIVAVVPYVALVRGCSSVPSSAAFSSTSSRCCLRIMQT